MSSYLYFIKVRILVSLAYRFEAISTVLIQFIVLMINAFFWSALYSTYDVVQDTTLDQMLVYSTMSVVLTCFFSKTVEGQIRDRVRQGNVAVDYIKPIEPMWMYLAEDIGGIIVNTVMRAVPIIIFACIFVRPPVPASFARLLLFLTSAVFSFLILWFIAAIFGLFNFWVINMGNIGGAKDMIVGFLSGSVVPIWFFPQAVQNVMSYLPFIYIYQTPISIYIGRTPMDEAGLALLIQFVWVIVFYMLFSLVKRRAAGHVVVQGG